MKPSDHSVKIRVLRGVTSATLQRDPWQALDSSENPASSNPQETTSTEPQPLVELQHQADHKDCIIVTCTCGKRIEISCEV